MSKLRNDIEAIVRLYMSPQQSHYQRIFQAFDQAIAEASSKEDFAKTQRVRVEEFEKGYQKGFEAGKASVERKVADSIEAVATEKPKAKTTRRKKSTKKTAKTVAELKKSSDLQDTTEGSVNE